MQFPNSRPASTHSAAHPEDGYVLLAVLILVFFVLLALAVAAPRIAKQIQRDKETEAVERGLQYQRAIKLYYKKFGAYPNDIKQLEKTNEIRFLRRRYTDPITGKDDWRIIHVGEAKVPPLGFFGEPLQAGMSSQSTGPGLNGINGGTQGSTGSGPGSSGPGQTGGSSFGFSNSGGAGGSGGGFGSSGSGSGGFASGGSGTIGAGSNGPGTGQPGGFGFNNGPSGGSSNGGTGSFGNGQSGGPGQPGQTGTGGFSSGPAGQSGGFGGGGPIIGVGIPMDKASLRVYHKQKKYSQWEFVYDPQQELAAGLGGGAASGQNPAGVGPNGPGNSGSSGFGQGGNNGPGGFNNTGGSSGGSGGFGFGNGSNGGSSGSGFGFGNGSGSPGGGTPNPPPAAPVNPPQ